MHLTTYLVLLESAERTLASSYGCVADGHGGDADVRFACIRFADQCTRHAEALAPIVRRYDGHREAEPDRLRPEGLPAARSGPVGLLRDLQDLHQFAGLVDITWAMLGQAAAGARDRDLLDTSARCAPETAVQLGWLRTRMKAAAPQTLLVAP